MPHSNPKATPSGGARMDLSTGAFQNKAMSLAGLILHINGYHGPLWTCSNENDAPSHWPGLEKAPGGLSWPPRPLMALHSPGLVRCHSWVTRLVSHAQQGRPSWEQNQRAFLRTISGALNWKRTSFLLSQPPNYSFCKKKKKNPKLL